LKPINWHQECSKKKKKSPVVELQKREEERKKEGLPAAALLPYATMRDMS